MAQTGIDPIDGHPEHLRSARTESASIRPLDFDRHPDGSPAPGTGVTVRRHDITQPDSVRFHEVLTIHGRLRNPASSAGRFPIANRRTDQERDPALDATLARPELGLFHIPWRLA